ncbi:hypothetical protein, partial [Corynebacterium diphtheriae]
MPASHTSAQNVSGKPVDNPPPTGELDHKMSVPVDNFRISAKAIRRRRILWGKTPHKTIKGGSRSGGVCANR